MPRTNTRPRRAALILLTLAGLAAPAAATVPTAVYSTILSRPNSTIPGTELSFGSFDRPVVSANGQNWALLARSTAAGSNSVYIAGSGLTGQLVAREDTTLIDGLTINGMSDRFIGVNDSGQVSFQVTLNAVPTGFDRAVLRWDPQTGLTTIARRNDPAADTGNTLFNMSDARITNAGEVAFIASSLGGAPTATNAAIIGGNNTQTILRKGVDAPAAQLDGGSRLWNAFPVGGFSTAADGANFLVRATLTGASATNTVVAVNNTTRIQAGSPLPGSDITTNVAAVQNAAMTPAGDWTARGTSAGPIDWAVLNGAVIARTGDAVPGGLPGETFARGPWTASNANAFFSLTADPDGNPLIGAFTTAPAGRNAVWVYDGRIVLRSGDGVDTNGDGQPDLFYTVSDLGGVSLNNKIDGAVAGDGFMYLNADLADANGTVVGQALLRVALADDTTPPCPADFNADGTVTTADITAFLSAWFADRAAGSPPFSADFNADGSVTTADITAFLSAWFDARAGGC